MQSVLQQFALFDAPVFSEPYGSGHINGTYLVRCAGGARYILQRINTAVFHDPVSLMRNIELVTAHLRKKIADPRGVLRLVPTTLGAHYAVEGGEYWRVYELVQDSVCFQAANRTLFYECAVAFGSFQNHLADFPAELLAETIPHFHDTPARYRALRSAIAKNASGRCAQTESEIDFALSFEPFSHTLVDLQASGALPLRVTHNDTKINNVLFDEKTKRALCVIDLDTVMPGLAVNDFGDAIRFGASAAAEDETDLTRVRLDLGLYQAYVDGYLSTCGRSLTQAELEMLPVGAKMMTLECGVRFLADHIAGDVYFHIARENHNLDRARTQFQLVRDMDAHWDDMCRVTGEAAKRI